MSAERATFDSSWCSNNAQTKKRMRDCLSEWEGLKQRYRIDACTWRNNITNNKQRLNTMKRDNALVSLFRRFQEFGEVVDERRARLRLQVQESQNAEARVQTELINQAKRLAREKAELQVQARDEEGEARRQKARDGKEEPGVGHSVEELKFNRDKRENAAKLEKHPDVYYHGPHCSNLTHPEAIDHHAAEIAYTWYDWMTKELICPVDVCLSPVMTCISVTDAQHAKLMEDMRHTSEQAFCHSTEGIPRAYHAAASTQQRFKDTGRPSRNIWDRRTLTGLCASYSWKKLIKLPSGNYKLAWAVNPGSEQGGWHQAQVTYFIHRAADELNGGAP